MRSPGSTSDPIYGVLGERLRKRRHNLGLKLREVAKSSGLRISTISEIETGQKAVTLHTLGLIARALGLKLATLFRGL